MHAFRSPLYRLITLFLAVAWLGGSLNILPASASTVVSQEGSLAGPTGALIKVTTNADDMTNNGNCTLREAIWAANNDTARDQCTKGSGSDTIVLDPGTYQLGLGGPGENNGLTGDLDLISSLTIQGAGADKTIIDGKGIDRVFHVLIGGGEVRIQSLTIQGGVAPSGSGYGGGGILVQSGVLYLTNLLITGNNAPTGGGMDNDSSAILSNVTIKSNEASGKGGGIFNNSQLTGSGLTISGNKVTGNGTGGGINNSGPAHLVNVTISGNTSVDGGGIYNEAQLVILSSTIHANSSGISNAGTMRIKNSIISGSSPGENCPGNTGSYTSTGYNIDSGVSCKFDPGTNFNSTNPGLGALQNNGGPTFTHALLEGSQAIDRGDNVDCPNTDQRVYIRPVTGINGGSKVCDIGAFEYGSYKVPSMFLPVLIRP